MARCSDGVELSVITLERDESGWRCVDGNEESLKEGSWNWQLEVDEEDDNPYTDSSLEDYSLYLKEGWVVEPAVRDSRKRQRQIDDLVFERDVISKRIATLVAEAKSEGSGVNAGGV